MNSLTEPRLAAVREIPSYTPAGNEAEVFELAWKNRLPLLRPSSP